MKTNWVVMQIKYKYNAMNSSPENEVVDVKLLTDSSGMTMFFESFEKAEDYVMSIAHEKCAYKYEEVG